MALRAVARLTDYPVISGLSVCRPEYKLPEHLWISNTYDGQEVRIFLFGHIIIWKMDSNWVEVIAATRNDYR